VRVPCQIRQLSPPIKNCLDDPYIATEEFHGGGREREKVLVPLLPPSNILTLKIFSAKENKPSSLCDRAQFGRRNRELATPMVMVRVPLSTRAIFLGSSWDGGGVTCRICEIFGSLTSFQPEQYT